MSLFLQVGFCKDANLLVFFDSSIDLKYRWPYVGHRYVRSSLYYAGSRNAGFMPCGSGIRNVLSIIETRA